MAAVRETVVTRCGSRNAPVREQFHEALASRTHTRRLSTLADLANVAVFMASDQASGLTGTIINLAMGSLDD